MVLAVCVAGCLDRDRIADGVRVVVHDVADLGDDALRDDGALQGAALEDHVNDPAPRLVRFRSGGNRDAGRERSVHVVLAVDLLQDVDVHHLDEGQLPGLGLVILRDQNGIPAPCLDLFGVDAVRYFLLHEMPFENDGVVSWELLIERVNSDLANTLGNLVNRTISMSNKYFGGVVTNTGVSEEVDEDLKKTVIEARTRINIPGRIAVRSADGSKASAAPVSSSSEVKSEISESSTVSEVSEEDKQSRLNTVLYNLIEGITIGASYLEPFMPETSAKILAQLNTPKRTVTELGQFGLYPSGNKVTDNPEILFARIDVQEMLDEIARRFPSVAEPEVNPEEEKKKEEAKKKEEKTEPTKVEAVQKALLTIDEFDKMQLQVGEILECAEVPNSKKLLCSQVQVAGKVLQIVSGIKNYYKAEEMVGKKVVVITNLKPAKLAGILSEGMLLCAEDDEGNLSLLTTEKDVPAGSMIS